MTLTETIKKVADLRNKLCAHEDTAKAKSSEMRSEIADLQRLINLDSALLDCAKINLAQSVIFVRGQYTHAGDERTSVISDAVHQIATGEKRGYRGLDHENFGTKSYDRWHGQRCDCQSGMGPKHGSIIFQVGLRKDARDRGGVTALTDDEREATIYMLTRLEAVQSAEASAAA